MLLNTITVSVHSLIKQTDWILDRIGRYLVVWKIWVLVQNHAPLSITSNPCWRIKLTSDTILDDVIKLTSDTTNQLVSHLSLTLMAWWNRHKSSIELVSVKDPINCLTLLFRSISGRKIQKRALVLIAIGITYLMSSYLDSYLIHLYLVPHILPHISYTCKCTCVDSNWDHLPHILTW